MESTDQILVNKDAVTELVNCVGLPEWNLHGEMSDWIQIVAEAVGNLGVEIPKSGICPNCDEWRLDRTSEDGTWEVTFATHCPHCGEGTEEDDLRDWKYEVANGDTVLGFEDWKHHRVEAQ